MRTAAAALFPVEMLQALTPHKDGASVGAGAGAGAECCCWGCGLVWGTAAAGRVQRLASMKAVPAARKARRPRTIRGKRQTHSRGARAVQPAALLACADCLKL